MKVISVHPGILPIPPKNWGAIEKCIWNYHLNFQKLGIESEIKYLDEIKNDGYSIIHSHVTNLSNIAHERGLEYFFSMHDHHVLLDYPNQQYLNETRQAIKNSIKTFVHTEEFFTHKNFEDLKDKFIYLRHGVDPELYINNKLDRNGILCVASNGFIGFPNFDRKGFLLAKDVASFLNIPLTICCPSNTTEFLTKNGFIDNPNITVHFDLDENALINQYNTHKVFLHPSILEAGHPNLTLVEALSCGIPVIGTYKGSMPLNGMLVVNDLTPISYVNAINYLFQNYEHYSTITSDNSKFKWESVSKDLIGEYKKYGHTKKKFVDTILFSYADNTNLIHGINNQSNISVNFDMVPSVEMKTIADKNHNVKFVTVDENKNESILYQTMLSNNMWAKPSEIYSKNWKIYLDDELKYETDISFDSICAVVSTYPNSADVKNKTINTLKNIKDNIGLSTICATHLDYKNDPDIINNSCDHYVMNPINTLTKHTYYRYYNGIHDNHKIFLDLWNSNNGMYHGPAVHQNYYNGIRVAKKLGYKYALLTNFDMLFSSEDINKIKCVLNTVVQNNSNGFFFYTSEPEGPTYKTVFCVINVDVFLSVFSEIKNEDDYSNFVNKVGSESNSLENVYYHALKNTDNLIIKEIPEWQFFTTKECFTNSQGNYLAILPVEDANQYCLFIRRPNKNITKYEMSVQVIDTETLSMICNKVFYVESDFVTLIPLDLDKTRNYKLIVTETFDSDNMYIKTYEINDFNSLEKNGNIKRI